MIWAIVILLALLVAAYLVWPLFFGSISGPGKDREAEEYFAEIEKLEKKLKQEPENKKVLRAEITALERRILARQEIVKTRPKPLLAVLVLAFFVFTSGGIYYFLGQPGYEKLTREQNAEQKRNEQIYALVEQLRQKLQQDEYKNDPKGWEIYARTLFSLGELQKAEKAYRRAVELSPDNKQLQAEFEQVTNFISRQKMLQGLSPTQRDEMIINMVENLAEKLKQEPENIDGWIRLLRARSVLGDEQKLRQDIKTMRQVYKDRPQIIAKIISQSGLGKDGED